MSDGGSRALETSLWLGPIWAAVAGVLGIDPSASSILLVLPGDRAACAV